MTFNLCYVTVTLISILLQWLPLLGTLESMMYRTLHLYTIGFLCFRRTRHKQLPHFSHLGQINCVLCSRDPWFKDSILSLSWPLSDKFTMATKSQLILSHGCYDVAVFSKAMNWKLGSHNVEGWWNLEEVGSSRKWLSHCGGLTLQGN